MDPATTEIYTLSLHDALPILPMDFELGANLFGRQGYAMPLVVRGSAGPDGGIRALATPTVDENRYPNLWDLDRKSTRLNSSHTVISYAVFCLKKKKNNKK